MKNYSNHVESVEAAQSKFESLTKQQKKLTKNQLIIGGLTIINTVCLIVIGILQYPHLLELFN